jgi:murein DD-endopeptidase MepM/ murein hydrolase activator NlpD
LNTNYSSNNLNTLNEWNRNLGHYIPEPPKKKKKIGRKILAILLIAWFFHHLYSSDLFEREAPKIEFLNESNFWNIKNPIPIKITDNVSINNYKISISSRDTTKVIVEKSFNFEKNKDQEDNKIKNIELNISFPSVGFSSTNEPVTLTVEVSDNSSWNWLKGNSTEQKLQLQIDTKKPKINIINKSYGIRKGGSAVVVFELKEDNIEQLFIETSYGKKFIPQPFYRNNNRFFISLLAWDLRQENFSSSIVAIDKAGNKTKNFISFYLKNKKYKESKINLRDSFLNGKITELAKQHKKSHFTDNPLEYFKIVNETMRKENEGVIDEYTSIVNKSEVVKEFNIKPFQPMRRAAPVASYGDFRKFFYDGQFVSKSNHLGLDMASVRNAPLYSSNAGKVAFVGNSLGIFGHIPVIDHGLGLYTIYAHCDAVKVSKGDTVSANQVIANTGVSGLALGDHLHFGIYVQGIPVRPEEWMDSTWIKTNITDIIASAKQLTARK